MTIEAALITFLFIGLFLTFCVAIFAAQEVKKAQKENVECLAIIARVAAYVKHLADQDVEIFKRLEAQSHDFIRREEAN